MTIEITPAQAAGFEAAARLLRQGEPGLTDAQVIDRLVSFFLDYGDDNAPE